VRGEDRAQLELAEHARQRLRVGLAQPPDRLGDGPSACLVLLVQVTAAEPAGSRTSLRSRSTSAKTSSPSWARSSSPSRVPSHRMSARSSL
jgi:hypothetical protein